MNWYKISNFESGRVSAYAPAHNTLKMSGFIATPKHFERIRTSKAQRYHKVFEGSGRLREEFNEGFEGLIEKICENMD